MYMYVYMYMYMYMYMYIIGYYIQNSMFSNKNKYTIIMIIVFPYTTWLENLMNFVNWLKHCQNKFHKININFF